MCMRGAHWEGSAGRHAVGNDLHIVGHLWARQAHRADELTGAPSSWTAGCTKSCSASRHSQPPQRTSEARTAGIHWAPVNRLNGSRILHPTCTASNAQPLAAPRQAATVLSP